ncbi:hypothetical protein HCN44_010024 [Aphidius gifuensis]|uniref:Uncharacterized protein n=1 Tax=Aphidius gifuensis TaxID=684658 RepID=A0A834Y5C5_APHGI|nr:hypothetical protein HCN44_010024 [Aphidius gifuensis]
MTESQNRQVFKRKYKTWKYNNDKPIPYRTRLTYTSHPEITCVNDGMNNFEYQDDPVSSPAVNEDSFEVISDDSSDTPDNSYNNDYYENILMNDEEIDLRIESVELSFENLQEIMNDDPLYDISDEEDNIDDTVIDNLDLNSIESGFVYSAKMIYGCNLPVDLVQSIHFINYSKSLRPGYEPPAVNKLSNDLLLDLHDHVEATAKCSNTDGRIWAFIKISNCNCRAFCNDHCNAHYYAVIKKCNFSAVFRIPEVNLSRIYACTISNDVIAIDVKNIISVCFYMKIEYNNNNLMYLAKPINVIKIE